MVLSFSIGFGRWMHCITVPSTAVNAYTLAMNTLVMATEAAVRVKGCCQQVADPIDNASADEIAALGKALSDSTRVQLLHMLKAAEEPICVCDFTAAFDLGQPTISHHLAKLRDAGLVRSHKRGIWSFYALRDDLSPRARDVLTLVP
jgi:ArsR family transcriptional regulator